MSSGAAAADLVVGMLGWWLRLTARLGTYASVTCANATIATTTRCYPVSSRGRADVGADEQQLGKAPRLQSHAENLERRISLGFILFPRLFILDPKQVDFATCALHRATRNERSPAAPRVQTQRIGVEPRPLPRRPQSRQPHIDPPVQQTVGVCFSPRLMMSDAYPVSAASVHRPSWCRQEQRLRAPSVGGAARNSGLRAGESHPPRAARVVPSRPSRFPLRVLSQHQANARPWLAARPPLWRSGALPRGVRPGMHGRNSARGLPRGRLRCLQHLLRRQSLHGPVFRLVQVHPRRQEVLRSST